MKKKILSFVLAICLILPFGIMLSGCEMKENNNTTQIEQIQQTKVLNVNDAYNLYQLALIQYEMGYKDTRTNLKITNPNNSNVYKFYTTTDGTQVVIENNYFYWLEQNFTTYFYNTTNSVKTTYKYSDFVNKHSSYTLGILKNEEENLLSYDIDDDGNYVFVFAEKNENETTVDYNIYEYVISSELKFLSTYHKELNYSKDGSHSAIDRVTSYKFEYNTITEDEILPILTTAKQASVQ